MGLLGAFSVCVILLFFLFSLLNSSFLTISLLWLFILSVSGVIFPGVVMLSLLESAVPYSPPVNAAPSVVAFFSRWFLFLTFAQCHCCAFYFCKCCLHFSAYCFHIRGVLAVCAYAGSVCHCVLIFLFICILFVFQPVCLSWCINWSGPTLMYFPHKWQPECE